MDVFAEVARLTTPAAETDYGAIGLSVEIEDLSMLRPMRTGETMKLLAIA